MGFNDIDIKVSGGSDIISTLQTYTTKILKPNIVDGKNVLTQEMLSSKNTKYVIKYVYELLGTTLTMPQNVILEFDGGSIKNGTLVGNDTLMLNTNETESVLDNVTLDGTWKESSYDLVEEVVADKAPGDGMGRIILRKDKTFAEQLTQENTIYVIQYDFELTEDVTIPANCVLRFEGGSISNGTIIFNNTYIDAYNYAIFRNINIPYNTSGEPFTTQENTYIDWFYNDENIGGIHKSYLSALQIGKKVIFSKRKEYVFSKCFTKYQEVVHDVEIVGNNSIWRFSETFCDNTNWPDVLYHDGMLNAHDFTVYWEPEDALRTDEGHVGNMKRSRLFSGGYSSNAKCILENIALFVLHKNSAQNTFYETYCGTDFIVRNCKKIASVSNDASAIGGGSFLWFMLGSQDNNPEYNITIENCECVVEGKDEAVTIFDTREISHNQTRNIHINNCKFESINSVGNGVGLLVVGSGEITSSNFTCINNLSIDNSYFVSHMPTPILFSFIREDKLGSNLIAKVNNSVFEYKGTYDFDQTDGRGLMAISLRGDYKNQADIDFNNCIVKNGNLLYTNSGRCIVTFNNCTLDILRLSSNRGDHVSSFYGFATTFKNCNITLGRSSSKCDISNINFYNCTIATIDGNVWTPKQSAPNIIQYKNTRMNGLKFPDTDKYHILCCNSYEYNWSPVINALGKACLNWYNDTDAEATIVFNGNTYTVAANSLLRHIEGPAISNPTKIPVTINGHKRYVYACSLEQYNDSLYDDSIFA